MHTYSLIMADDGHGVAQRIELEARCAKDALTLISKDVANRKVELRQDGRQLAMIFRIRDASWSVFRDS